MAAHMWIERTLVMTARRRQLGPTKDGALMEPVVATTGNPSHIA